jgi:[protein-PII] uridylyltransferase
LAWASTPGGALAWDEPTLDAFYLLLRAADPRSWEFLDISGLLVRYLPEWAVVYRRPPGPGGDLALDSHTFEVLRRLHEWSASGEAASQRVWPRLRHRDWLYVAAFLHELSPDGARSACERIGLPAEGCATVTFVIEHFRELTQVATQRDLHDEELVLDLAGTIGTLQRLDHLYALAIAEDQGLGGASWTPWKAQLLNDLFARLEHLLEHPAESGVRQRRSLDHLRQQAADELRAIGCNELISMVPHLPHRFLLARPPSAVARHLALAGQDLPAADAVQIQATPHRSSAVWELEVVARDRPGLLATIAGVLSLRGITVLSADAATCSNGLVLDVFTVASAYGQPLDAGIWPKVRADLEAGLKERLPLRDLLAHRTSDEPSGATVRVDNTASQFYSLVEVRAPDRVGLLYRIALGLSELGVDIHHAKIATQPSGVIDTFYVWKATGGKLEEGIASIVACELERRLA